MSDKIEKLKSKAYLSSNFFLKELEDLTEESFFDYFKKNKELLLKLCKFTKVNSEGSIEKKKRLIRNIHVNFEEIKKSELFTEEDIMKIMFNINKANLSNLEFDKLPDDIALDIKRVIKYFIEKQKQEEMEEVEE